MCISVRLPADFAVTWGLLGMHKLDMVLQQKLVPEILPTKIAVHRCLLGVHKLIVALQSYFGWVLFVASLTPETFLLIFIPLGFVLACHMSIELNFVSE